MLRRIIASSLLLASLASCVHLNSVSLTQIPEKRTNKVSASSDKWIFFLLNFDNDYVDKINDDLKEKCPGGKIQGILTKDEVTYYFLALVLKRKVTATGYCSKA